MTISECSDLKGSQKDEDWESYALDLHNLQVELWKSLGRNGVNFLKEALNKIADDEKIPGISRKSIIDTHLQE